MVHSPLFRDDYKPQFSGHETFPLRYGWLKKAYDRVIETQDEDEEDNKAACWSEEAIAQFGVGKNMVASIRHWANVAGIIEEPSSTKAVKSTLLGDKLFGIEGLDPYMEHPATLWLVHWQLAGSPARTTWFWAFSHYSEPMFEREEMANQLHRFAENQQWPRAAAKTIKNDVICFIRTYAAPQASVRTGGDDALDSPLTELGLIKNTGKKDGFRFVRGPQPTLSDGVFAYALLDFWKEYSSGTSTLSFEAIAHAPGSPGRVFALDENSVIDRLSVLDACTKGALRWSETAGLKQVARNADVISDKTKWLWLKRDYRRIGARSAA